MSQYKEMDRRILQAVEQHDDPLHSRHCCDEAERLATATGRDSFRVIDGRLQSLRKAGKICHRTKAESYGRGGWHLVTPNV